MWSLIVDCGTPSSDDRFRVNFTGERLMEVANAAHVSNRAVFLPLRGLSLTLPRANTRFFPIQQCRSSWWSLIKPFPECSHHLGHGLSRVLSLMHLHTCHQALLDRVTACISHTENTTKFCGFGKSRVHYLGHLPNYHFTLYCVLCCAV